MRTSKLFCHMFLRCSRDCHSAVPIALINPCRIPPCSSFSPFACLPCTYACIYCNYNSNGTKQQPNCTAVLPGSAIGNRQCKRQGPQFRFGETKDRKEATSKRPGARFPPNTPREAGSVLLKNNNIQHRAPYNV